ncbi:MAG TPA: hypothetical protein VIM61_08730, partial [Chthoniobacterales bacterium]
MPVRHDLRDPERRRAQRSFRVTFALVALLHIALVALLAIFAARAEVKQPMGDITWLDAGAFTDALTAAPETPEDPPEEEEPTP